MTDKTDRREFLKTAFAILVGVTGVGDLTSETALGETTTRRPTPQRPGLNRRSRTHTVDRTLPKPETDSNSPTLFSSDNLPPQEGQTKLYNLVSPISLENGKGNTLDDLLQTPDLPRFLWDAHDPDKLIALSKKLGLKPREPSQPFIFSMTFLR
jgi:hypothetical protein